MSEIEDPNVVETESESEHESDRESEHEVDEVRFFFSKSTVWNAGHATSNEKHFEFRVVIIFKI